MINTETIKNAINILEDCLESKISVSQGSIKNGFSNTYIKNIKLKILQIPESERTDEQNYVLELHKLALGVSFSKPVENKKNSDMELDKNLEIDENFDKRSTSKALRDTEDKITHYEFEILVRDEQPFIGSISRHQMELLYAYYPYVTRNSVSQLFPFFTFVQFKRILRVFNITKDKLFPPHLLEELSDTEVAELALKNKEMSAHKKFVENKNKFYETKLREAQTKLFQIEEDTTYIENIVDKSLDKFFELRENVGYKTIEKHVPNTSKTQKENDSIYFVFGDIHFGKCFNETVFGRGVNKDILEERCMEIAYEVVRQTSTKQYKNIYLNVLGDIFESILPDGMHPGHHMRMDLIGDEQLSLAMNVFEKMVDYIKENIDENINIFLYGIGGNHDRIQENRDQDKRRTATAIFYTCLKKIFSLKNYQNVVVYEPIDGILKYADNGISFIGFHGDSPLSKSKEIDIMNLFKVGDSRNYTVILSGHWHSIKISEGINYKKIICGSVCSVDEYIQNELGKGSQPSYTIIKKSAGFGVDVEIKTLY